VCIKCGKLLQGKQTKYCSVNCKSIVAVAKRRRVVKQMALDYKGGRCIDCGYNKCNGALQFHHPNGDKEFGIADKGITRSWAKVKAELDKCVLVCANCHAERHWRVV
jgi:ribonuclease HII